MRTAVSEVMDDETQIGRVLVRPKAPVQWVPFLRVVEPRNMYIRLRVSLQPSVIGRSRDADLFLNDSRISRRHCTVRVVDETVLVEDLDSRNGMLVNGQSVAQAIICPKDHLQIGGFQLKLEYRDPDDVLSEDALILAATTDALTGTANRRHLLDCADAAVALAQRAELDVSIIMLDLDHFKAINDRFGHPAGDAALSTCADILLRAKRKQDILGRYGGEEFMLLLPGADCVSALQFSNRIRELVENAKIVHANRELRITLSGGVFSAKGCGISSLSTMIARADLALYEAKRSGRNRIVAFSGF